MSAQVTQGLEELDGPPWVDPDRQGRNHQGHRHCGNQEGAEQPQRADNQGIERTTSRSDARRPAVVTTAMSRPIGSVWLRNDSIKSPQSRSTRWSGAPFAAILLKSFNRSITWRKVNRPVARTKTANISRYT